MITRLKRLVCTMTGHRMVVDLKPGYATMSCRTCGLILGVLKGGD